MACSSPFFTACFASGETRLVNCPQARIKETDRIGDLACELRKLGGKIEEHEDADFDAQPVTELQRASQHQPERLVRFSTPTFKEYESSELQNYRAGVSSSMQQQFVAEVMPEQGRNGLVSVVAKNKFRVGDELELLTPAHNHRFSLEYIEDMQGRSMQEVPGGGYEIRLKLPVPEADMGLITRYL